MDSRLLGRHKTCGYSPATASAVGMLLAAKTHFEKEQALARISAEGNGSSVEQASADLICDDATASGLWRQPATGLPTIAARN